MTGALGGRIATARSNAASRAVAVVSDESVGSSAIASPSSAISESSRRTLVAVLHDLDQAARFADHLIVMKDGEVVATGPPHEVLTAELVERVFELPCLVLPDPVTGTPAIYPLPSPAHDHH